MSNNSSVQANPWSDLNVPYTVSEVLVAVAAIVGNCLVILVFGKEKRLRRRTKYYIISLAVADLLVGLLGIPFAILASVGLPRNFYLCLFTVSLLVVLCTISIFCLVAVSVDRYWAILYPMSYSRNVRSRTAIGIIIVCWLLGAFVGFLPLLGWNKGASFQEKCLFVKVMDYNYLVFLYFATIIVPAVLLAAFYAHIYQVVLKQLRQMVMFSPGSLEQQTTTTTSASCRSSGVMLRVLGAAQKREVKATQNLSIIVLFFIVCWIPLYTINCVKAFCPKCEISETWTYFCIILSHLNSSFNPFLYAYHLKDFRAALHNLVFKDKRIISNSLRYDVTVQIQRRTPEDLGTRRRDSSLPSAKSSIVKENLNVSVSFDPDRKNSPQTNHLWTLTEMASTSEEDEHKYLGVENSVFLYVDDTDDDDVFVAQNPRKSTRNRPIRIKSHSMYSLQNPKTVNDDRHCRSVSESQRFDNKEDAGIALSVTRFYKKNENDSDLCPTRNRFKKISNCLAGGESNLSVDS